MKKLNLRLNKSTANTLKANAKKEGYSIASYIRAKITDSNNVNVWFNEEENLQDNIQFSLRLDYATNTLLTKYSERSSLPKAVVVRKILSSSLRNKKQPSNKSHVRNLWNKGLLNEVAAFLGEKIDLMSDEDLIIYAETNIHRAKLNKVLDAIELLEKRALSEENKIGLLGYVYKLRSEVANYESDFENNSIFINRALEVALQTKDRRLIGSVYGELGKAQLYRENFAEAYRYSTKALDYLDIINYPVEYTRVFSRLMSILPLISNKEEQIAFNKHLIELLTSVDSDRFWGCYYSYLAYFNISSDSSGAKTVATNYKKALKHYVNSGSKVGLIMNYGFMGFTQLNQGNYSNAYINFTNSEIFDKRYLPNKKYSRSRLAKLFIESKDNFNESIKLMEKTVLSNEKASNNIYEQYTCAAAKYLHSPNPEIKKQGEITLKEINVEASYPLMRQAAHEALSEKKFSYLP